MDEIKSSLTLDDDRFVFDGYWRKSWGHLRVYHHRGLAIAVISEVITEDGQYASSGTSTINAIENVATRIKELFSMDVLISYIPNKVKPGRKFIEPLDQESFAKVDVIWDHNRASHCEFKHISREDVEYWIGQEFKDIPHQKKDNDNNGEWDD